MMIFFVTLAEVIHSMNAVLQAPIDIMYEANKENPTTFTDIPKSHEDNIKNITNWNRGEAKARSAGIRTTTRNQSVYLKMYFQRNPEIETTRLTRSMLSESRTGIVL